MAWVKGFGASGIGSQGSLEALRLNPDMGSCQN